MANKRVNKYNNMTDLDIAKKIKLKHISEIANKLGLQQDDIDMYGKYKAKLPHRIIDIEKVKESNLILVTAISPTPAGEGKTTMSIGLSEGLNQLGKQTTVVLREPSLGPVFGIKGGATGGGYSQVLPMEDINLHFTGDFSAIEKAHNLLSAVIDNNIQSKTNSLGIDARTVAWKRVMDMNDRSLRNIVIGLGGTTSGVPRETGFDITAASEIMAILCLADDLENLKVRLGNIFVGYTFDKRPVYARDLKVEGAMAALLKDAIKKRNYKVWYKDIKLKIDSVEVKKNTALLYLNKKKVMNSSQMLSSGEFVDKNVIIKVKKIRDTYGNVIHLQKYMTYNQYREFFVQELKTNSKKPLDTLYMLRNEPVFKNQPIAPFKNLQDYWMNTPLKNY